jgi:hypothetical protein
LEFRALSERKPLPRGTLRVLVPKIRSFFLRKTKEQKISTIKRKLKCRAAAWLSNAPMRRKVWKEYRFGAPEIGGGKESGGESMALGICTVRGE